MENFKSGYKFFALKEGLKISNWVEKLFYFMHHLRRLFLVIITVTLLNTKIDDIQSIIN